MDNTERLNTLCPVCDGPVSFEAYRLGEWVNCPHCQEMIALGSVEPLPAPRAATSRTAVLRPGATNGFKLLACAAAMFCFLAGCVLLYRKVAAVQPQPKSHGTELAAIAKESPPVLPPVALPAAAPAPLPPIPNP